MPKVTGGQQGEVRRWEMAHKAPPAPPESPPLHGTVGMSLWGCGVGVYGCGWHRGGGELGDAGRRGVGEEASHFQTSETLLCPQDLSLWGWFPLPQALYFLQQPPALFGGEAGSASLFRSEAKGPEGDVTWSAPGGHRGHMWARVALLVPCLWHRLA